ncbi:hypothetical protein NKG05_00095 [Oerskovia sp. M15]
MVGPLFLLNAIAGFVLGLLVLVWRHWLPLLGAIGFSVATLGAFYLSTTVGFFSVNETVGGVQQVTAAVSEWVALVGALLALVVERRRAPGRSRRTPDLRRYARYAMHRRTVPSVSSWRARRTTLG